jgi:hypothetical protein
MSIGKYLYVCFDGFPREKCIMCNSPATWMKQRRKKYSRKVDPAFKAKPVCDAH